MGCDQHDLAPYTKTKTIRVGKKKIHASDVLPFARVTEKQPRDELGHHEKSPEWRMGHQNQLEKPSFRTNHSMLNRFGS
jgi:hypothetical protein